MYDLTFLLDGSSLASSFHRSRRKAAWMYIGFSHQSVPSLSNAAIRRSGGTKLSEVSSVMDCTASIMRRFASPSFQFGRKSITFLRPSASHRLVRLVRTVHAANSLSQD